ncbi:MAG: PAS domain S-box protein [Desulfocapsaceae bacterium]|nr:PAS domain S-box protein [Desulfocapsaceae bacterium]
MKIPLELSNRVRSEDIIKRFLIIFLPLAIFFGSLTFFLYFKDVKIERKTVESNEVINIQTQMETVAATFNQISMDLKFQASQNELAGFLQNGGPEYLKLLSDEWRSLCTIKSFYYKIRYIDENGIEILSVSRNRQGGGNVLSTAPVNVSEKDYFKRTIGLPEDAVYISPFDLSTDNENERQSPEPIVRVGVPVFDKSGRKRGVLILNYLGTLLIDELKKASASSPGSTVLVHADSYYLTSPDQDKDWDVTSKEKPAGIKRHLPEEWQRINQHESGQFHTEDGMVTFGTIYPLLYTRETGAEASLTLLQAQQKEYTWKIASYVPTKMLSIMPIKILNRIFLLYTVCLVIIAICSFLLARTGMRRKTAEEAVRERDEQLRAINSAAANAIIVIDNNRKILHWNPAAEKLFQYTQEEAMDKPITAIIAPPKHQSTFTKISKKFNLPDKDSRGSKIIELFGYKKDGTEFPVEVSFSAFKSGEQWHTVGIIRDISARKKMEQEVLRAQKFESLGVLASGIAHDFNNLLTAIIGNINLVCQFTNPSDENYDLLKSADKAALRAKALSQQLLVFSKSGNPVRKTSSIAPLIRDSADFALHGSTVSCTIHTPEDLWLVDIDTGQISQVVQNLIINSKEAVSGSGTIEISCSNETAIDIPAFSAPVTGNFVKLQIRDTGCGIVKRDLPKIFDPYFTTKDYGSGLGLAIVYSILQKHDGHITVQSEPGQGTTFTLFLPASLDQHLKKEEKGGEAISDRHYRIMVVDGEEMLLNIARRMLVHLGHECICVKNSIEAIEIYKHLWKTGTPVDGVIIDLTIPGGMGGKETAGAIYDINPEARIIVSSGYSHDPVMVDYDEYGFCAAIAKPFDISELKDTMDSVME